MLKLEIIISTWVKNLKNMLIVQFFPGMNCLHLFFPFLYPGIKFNSSLFDRDEFIPAKHVNSNSHITIDKGEIYTGM